MDITARGMASKNAADLASIAQEIEELQNTGVDTTARTAISHFEGVKHRVLVIPTIHQSYSYQPFDQLRNQGLMVQVTSLEYFTEHVNEMIRDYDVLIMNQGSGISDRVWWLDHLTRVTAQQVANALLLWKSSGKKYIYLWFDANGVASVKKYNIDGAAAETVDISSTFIKTNTTTGTIPAGQGTFEVTANCPLTADELLDMRWLNFSSRNIYPRNRTGTYGLLAGEEVLVENVLGETKEVYVFWKPYEYAAALYGGVVGGDNLNSPTYKYINVGSLARLLIGNTSPIRLAMDCIHSRKVAATGYDCDLTTGYDAIDALVQGHNGRPLELGFVTSKLTSDLVSRYRNLDKNISLCSHSKYHFGDILGANVTVTGESHVVPSSRVIKIKFPYRAYNLVVKIGATTLTKKEFIEAVSATQYGYDEPRGLIKLHADNIGATVTLDYKYLKETEEWVGSLKDLETNGMLTNDIIYLTGGEYAMHGTTQALLRKRNVIVCNYSVPNPWAWVAVKQGYNPIFTPYLADEVEGGFKAWFSLVSDGYSQAEIEAVDGKAKESIDNANSRKHPFIWYDHDFVYADEVNGIHQDAGVHADWKGATYEETRQKLIAGLKTYFNRLDQENVYWMFRSEYHKRYKDFNDGFVYNVISDGNTHKVYMQNKGKNQLPGVTFRSSQGITSAKLLPNTNLTVTTYAGDDLVSFDVAPGEKLVAEIVTSA